MGKTKIEWAERVWNPVTGCTPVSEGCTNCYAKRMAQRLRGRYGYPQDDPFRVTLHPDRLGEPWHWRKPSIVFVCSMGDLFHEDVPVEFINRVWIEMSLCGRQTFLVLTKRPQRMSEVLKEIAPHHTSLDGSTWPLPNVWLGASVENQAAADERILHLLQTPAAKRFVSYEPLLGPVSNRWRAFEYGAVGHPIDWVIVGGESGPGARPCQIRWIESLIDQCAEVRVPVFVKQLGAYPWWAGAASSPVEPERGKNNDPDAWPEELRVREFPGSPHE